jgi:hypothetical protein
VSDVRHRRRRWHGDRLPRTLFTLTKEGDDGCDRLGRPVVATVNSDIALADPVIVPNRGSVSAAHFDRNNTMFDVL